MIIGGDGLICKEGYNEIIYSEGELNKESVVRKFRTTAYDFYKEIIMNYRRIITDLEVWRIQEYADVFPKSKMISKAIDEEVM